MRIALETMVFDRDADLLAWQVQAEYTACGLPPIGTWVELDGRQHVVQRSILVVQDGAVSARVQLATGADRMRTRRNDRAGVA